MIDLKSVRFGSDAEVFLRTRTGHPFPVCGLVGGTKDNPKPMAGMPEGFAVQEDNAALEWNVPATSNVQTFINNMADAQHWIKASLPATVYADLDSPVMEFDEAYIRNLPELGTFGCEPDYNAFTIMTNPTPRPPTPGFRSAAAHVHIGWSEPNDEDRLELIRLSDVFVTCQMIHYETEEDAKRRQLYGKAGAFRPKDYGVEHRVLSNRWVKSKSTIRDTLTQYQNAIAALNGGLTVKQEDYEGIQAAVNFRDLNACSGYWNKYWNALGKKLGYGWDWAAYYASFR